jgi:hypothetical protein
MKPEGEAGQLQGTLDGGKAKGGAAWERWTQVWQEIPHLFVTEDGTFVRPGKVRKDFPPVRFLQEDDYRLEFSNMGRKPKFNPNPVNLVPIPRTPGNACLIDGCSRESDKMVGICDSHTHEYEKNGKTLRGPMRALDQFADWIGNLVKLPGTQPKDIYKAPDHATATEKLYDGWVLKGAIGREAETRTKVMDEFVLDALVSIVGKVPDSTTMQLEYEQGRDTPNEVVKIVEGLVNRHFSGVTEHVDWVWNRRKNRFAGVPVRLVAGVLALGFAAEEANRGDLWFCESVLGDEARSGYASAYMSAAYYYLRRYAGANDKQARMSVK